MSTVNNSVQVNDTLSCKPQTYGGRGHIRIEIPGRGMHMKRNEEPRKRFMPHVALLGALALFLSILGVAAPASAEGNAGTIKVHALGSEPGTESNEPQVCAFNLEFYNFVEGFDGYVEFDVQGGDGPTGVAAGPFAVGTANADGYFESEYFNVDGGPAIANGHYKVTLYGKFNDGRINYEDVKAKSKVFKVDCPPPPTIPDCPAITGQVVVTPSNLQGFDFSQTRATGHYEFLENGLRIWTEGATSTDKVAGYKSVSVPLVDVGDPSLSFDNTSGGGIPGSQLVIDFDANGTPDGILVGEDVYMGDWWLTNSSAQFVKDGAPNTGGGSGSEWYGTLDEWLASYPDAVVKAFGFSLGSGVKGDGIITKITFNCTEYVFTTDKPAPGTAVASSDVCVKPGEATGVATVTVTNTDDATNAAVTYDVTLNSVVKQVNVADGSSGSVSFSGLAAGNYAWSVSGPDGTKLNGSVTVKACDVPPVITTPPPPVVTPPVVTPPEATPPKKVRGAVKSVDKCRTAGDMFAVRKERGVVYYADGQRVREGVWLKTGGDLRVVVKAKAASKRFKVVGQDRWVLRFTNKPCGSPDVPPPTGLRTVV